MISNIIGLMMVVLSAWMIRRYLANIPDLLPGLSPESDGSCSQLPRHSLLEPYQSDPMEAQLDRIEGMKKFGYNYSLKGIDRRHNLSLDEYYSVYDGKWPVILTDVVTKWPSWKKWTPDHLNKCCGHDRVYVLAVHLKKPSGISVPLSLFRANVHKSNPSTWTYVCDEIFLHTHRQLLSEIGDYVYFKENFFETLPKELKPWSAMLLWGSRYSRSTTHMDPYNWTGTNAVLYGSKQWKLYPPNQDPALSVFRKTDSGFPLSSFKYNSPYDGFDKDIKNRKDLDVLEFTQQAGELLIIPSGWIHQAYNPEQSIAVSSQMFTSYNLRTVLEEIIIAAEYNYGAEVKRSNLPKDVDSFTNEEKVKAVIHLLPSWVIEKGRKITEQAMNSVKKDKLND